MNLDAGDIATLIAGLAAAVVAWFVLAPYGLVPQIAGTVVAFALAGRAVS